MTNETHLLPFPGWGFGSRIVIVLAPPASSSTALTPRDRTLDRCAAMCEALILSLFEGCGICCMRVCLEGHFKEDRPHRRSSSPSLQPTRSIPRSSGSAQATIIPFSEGLFARSAKLKFCVPQITKTKSHHSWSSPSKRGIKLDTRENATWRAVTN